MLEQYRGLTYKLESFGTYNLIRCISFVDQTQNISYDASVFNDGSSKELLNIGGTIPVVYKSKLL